MNFSVKKNKPFFDIPLIWSLKLDTLHVQDSFKLNDVINKKKWIFFYLYNIHCTLFNEIFNDWLYKNGYAKTNAKHMSLYENRVIKNSKF